MEVKRWTARADYLLPDKDLKYNGPDPANLKWILCIMQEGCRCRAVACIVLWGVNNVLAWGSKVCVLKRREIWVWGGNHPNAAMAALQKLTSNMVSTTPFSWCWKQLPFCCQQVQPCTAPTVVPTRGLSCFGKMCEQLEFTQQLPRVQWATAWGEG